MKKALVVLSLAAFLWTFNIGKDLMPAFCKPADSATRRAHHDPVIALILGLIIIGGAQFYNGDTNLGILYAAIGYGISIFGYIFYWFLYYSMEWLWFLYFWWLLDLVVFFVWFYAWWTGYNKAKEIAGWESRLRERFAPQARYRLSFNPAH